MCIFYFGLPGNDCTKDEKLPKKSAAEVCIEISMIKMKVNKIIYIYIYIYIFKYYI